MNRPKIRNASRWQEINGRWYYRRCLQLDIKCNGKRLCFSRSYGAKRTKRRAKEILEAIADRVIGERENGWASVAKNAQEGA